MAEVQSIPELRFPEFDGIWVQKKLGKLLDITSSSRVLKDEWTAGGVPFFRSSDVVAHFKGEKNKKAYISFELYDSLSNKIGRVKKDDLLITGGGSIGIPFLIKNDDPLYFKDADLLWIKINDKVNGYFLYSFFLTQTFRKHLQSISHVGTIAHYTVVQAKNTPFNCPALSEQQKIASFLSAVDDRIQFLEKKKAKLEEYKRGVMQKLFAREIRFKDENGKDFPDWEEKKLGEVFNSKKGTGLSKNVLDTEGQFNCILYGELYTTYAEVIFDVVSKTNDEGGTLSKKGDLLVPSSTTTSAIDLANVTALNQDNVRLGGDITILRARMYVNNIFYAYYLSNFKKLEIARYGQGTTIVHLYYNHFKVMRIDVPSLKEQKTIATFLTSLDESIESLRKEIEGTTEYKKGLLQKMFV